MSVLEMPVRQRVTDLEDMMAQVWRTIERTQRQVDRTSREMREFKDEMREFKNEMREFKNETRRQWGELANKMGTMAEDLVAPSVPRILYQTVACPGDEIEFSAVRVRKLHPASRGYEREFDVVAACGEYVLINETKSRLSNQDVAHFVERLPQAREFFPEYADRKFIGAIASLYVDESVVRYGEKLGVIVLGFGQDVMEVLNSPGFVPRAF